VEKAVRFDPRVTIVALVVLAITIVVSRGWAVLGGTTVLLAAYLFVTGLRARDVLRSTAAVVWFAAAAMVVSMLTVPGNVLFGSGDLFITEEGIMDGLVLSARLVLLVWLSTSYVLSVPLVGTLDGIAALLHPLLRGRGNLLLVSGIAVAFVPMLLSTARRVRAARIARGEPEGTGFVANARFTASAAVPLFAAVFRSADELAQAMEARCFDPAATRTRYANLRIERRDWILAGIVTLWAILSLLVTLRPV